MGSSCEGGNCVETRSVRNNVWARLVAFAVLGFAAIGGPSAALAASGDFYLGVGAGMTRSKDITSDINDAFSTLGVTPTVEVEGPALKIFAEYQLVRFLALEVSYVDLGKYRGSGGGVTLSDE